jgi:hypothetical protein
MKHIKTYENNQIDKNIKSNIGKMLYHKFFSDNNENIIEINQYGHSGGLDIYFIFSETLDSRYFKDIIKMSDYLVNSFNVKKTNIYIDNTHTKREEVELIIHLEIGEQYDDLEYEAYNFLKILKDKSNYNL